MRTPGFTAEKSIYKSSGPGRPATSKRALVGHGGNIYPQVMWQPCRYGDSCDPCVADPTSPTGYSQTCLPCCDPYDPVTGGPRLCNPFTYKVYNCGGPVYGGGSGGGGGSHRGPGGGGNLM
jgi:hypothetical protein